MSAFYFQPSSELPQGFTPQITFVPWARMSRSDAGPVACFVSRADAAVEWDPYEDARAGVFVCAAGRPAFAGTPLVGPGAVTAAIARQWEDNPSGVYEKLNGGFCVWLIDTRRSELHLWTDRMGSYPCYAAEHGLCVSSHPDVIADALTSGGKRPALDATTLAEFLQTWSSSPPYTYYRGIRQMDPGSHYVWSTAQARLLKVEKLWEPVYAPSGEGVHRLAIRMAEAIEASVVQRARGRRTAVLLSGGIDSRAIVYTCPDPSAAAAYTFCDTPNWEVRAAQAIAKSAGIKHAVLTREFDHYAACAESYVRITSGCSSLVNNHVLGFAPILSGAADVLLTGCYADYMYKGLSLNRRCRTLFGKTVPLYSPAPFSPEYYLPHSQVAPEWGRKAAERIAERYGPGVESRYRDNPLNIEAIRLRPLSREGDSGNRLVAWHVLPWDPVYVDNRMLAVYQRLTVKDKINGTVWARAVRLLTPRRARMIPDNNSSARIGAGPAEKLAWYLLRIARLKALRALGRGPDGGRLTTGAWPNWRYYLSKSAVIDRMWTTPAPEARSLLSELTGSDPWKRTPAEWAAADAMLFCRLLTLKIWLEARSGAHPSAL